MTRVAIVEVKQTGSDEVTVTFADGTIAKVGSSLWLARMVTIKTGLEWEMRYPGGRLTRKAPSCFSIIKQELGIKTRDKIKAYREFCKMTGQALHSDFVKE